MRLLRHGAILLGWLAAGPPLLACDLPARPGAEIHPVFSLDPRESAIEFEADAGWHRFAGTARRVSGRIRVDDPSRPGEADACVEIDAASLTTGIGLRDEKMRESHLHTDRFPTIRFVLSGVERIEPVGDDRYRVTLRGSLTLHGVTRPVSAQASAQVSPTSIAAEGEVPVRLSAFEIPAPSFLFVTMKDTVIVKFKVKATRG